MVSSGISFLDRVSIISTSTDQRLIRWEVKEPATATELGDGTQAQPEARELKLVESVYTHVSDPCDLKVFSGRGAGGEGDGKRWVGVCGIGLELLELGCEG